VMVNQSKTEINRRYLRSIFFNVSERAVFFHPEQTSYYSVEKYSLIFVRKHGTHNCKENVQHV